MSRVVGATLLVGIGLLVGCSGNADEDEDEDKDVPAPTQCQKYVSTWCNKSLTCYAQVGRIDQGTAQANIPECIDKASARLPCSAATSVTEDFDKCISQIKGIACSKFDVPQLQLGTVKEPAICANAINYE